MLKTPKVTFHHPHHALSDGRRQDCNNPTSHVTANVLVIGGLTGSLICGCKAAQIYFDKQNAAFDLKNCVKDNHEEEGDRCDM